ncbi:MAG: aldehyde dehydrogenase family protein, partial [Chloroflexi bacterium]|nr:aldehyde dehydrogenase family protein [Chloroflexota bacterium]
MATAVSSVTQYKMLIGGEWVDATSGQTYDSMNPYTGQTWAQMPDAQAEDVDRAVQAARKAVKDPAWRGMVPAQRGALLRRLGDIVAENAEHLGQIETRDNGKLIREMSAQCKAVPSYFYFYAGLADKIQGATIPLEKTSVFNYTLREPIGVVGIIIPWNSPLLLLSF